MYNKTHGLRRIALVTLAAMFMATVLAACVNVQNIEDADLEQSFNIGESSAVEESSQDEISTPDGYTEAPTVEQIINISPRTVAVVGRCEPNSVIRVTGGVEDVETASKDGYDYYVIEVDLEYSRNLLEITAQTEGKHESLPREFVASYNATADTRLDGNSVSVGTDSRLYFDKMADSAAGKNLYTSSQVLQIRDYISNLYTAYAYDRASGQPVDLIVCLIPNVTTVYPEIIPDGTYEPANTTVYDQVLSALKQTRATVVDMREEFLALRDDSTVSEYGGLYRETDDSLSDYGAYLTYKAIMDKVAVRFPQALPRDISEFNVRKVSGALGGNLVSYRGIDNQLITEDIVRLEPGFSLALGKNSAGYSAISSLKKYVDPANKDYSYFTKVDSGDNVNGIGERWVIDTERSGELELPVALIYRDNSSFPFSDILAERFEMAVLARTGEYSINLSQTMQYKREGQAVSDYIIIIISEDSMDTAFSVN